MNHDTAFKLDDISDVKATLSITATVKEWQDFIAQCAAHADGTFQWDSQWVGNCYLVEFKHSIDRMLREAESHFAEYAVERREKAQRFHAVLDTVRPAADLTEFKDRREAK